MNSRIISVSSIHFFNQAMFDAPAAQIYYQFRSTNLSDNYLIDFFMRCVVVCYSSGIYSVAIRCNYK